MSRSPLATTHSVPTFTRRPTPHEHVVTFGVRVGPATTASSPSTTRSPFVVVRRRWCAHRHHHHRHRRQHAFASVAHAALAPRLLLFDTVARLVRLQFLREPEPQSVRRSGAAGHRFPRNAGQPPVRPISTSQQFWRVGGQWSGGHPAAVD